MPPPYHKRKWGWVSVDNILEYLAQRGLLGHFSPFACKNGEAILLQGEVPEWACLLTEGEAVVRTLDPDGFSAILYRYRPGEIFGDLEVVCRRRVITTVFAAGDCRGYRIGGEALLALLRQDAGLALRLYEKTARQQLDQSLERTGAKGKTVAVRLAALLLASADEQGVVTLPKQEMADALFTTLRSVHRALQQLEQAGLVRSDRRAVTLLSREELAALTV